MDVASECASAQQDFTKLIPCKGRRGGKRERRESIGGGNIKEKSTNEKIGKTTLVNILSGLYPTTIR